MISAKRSLFPLILLFIFLFEKLLSYIYKDFNENPYICEYYLNTPEEKANC